MEERIDGQQNGKKSIKLHMYIVMFVMIVILAFGFLFFMNRDTVFNKTVEISYINLENYKDIYPYGTEKVFKYIKKINNNIDNYDKVLDYKQKVLYWLSEIYLRTDTNLQPKLQTKINNFETIIDEKIKSTYKKEKEKLLQQQEISFEVDYDDILEISEQAKQKRSNDDKKVDFILNLYENQENIFDPK